jgi:hypothetical protein
MQNMKSISIEVGAWYPGTTTYTGDEQHLIHVELKLIDCPQNQPHQNSMTATRAEGC